MMARITANVFENCNVASEGTVETCKAILDTQKFNSTAEK